MAKNITGIYEQTAHGSKCLLLCKIMGGDAPAVTKSPFKRHSPTYVHLALSARTFIALYICMDTVKNSRGCEGGHECHTLWHLAGWPCPGDRRRCDTETHTPYTDYTLRQAWPCCCPAISSLLSLLPFFSESSHPPSPSLTGTHTHTLFITSLFLSLFSLCSTHWPSELFSLHIIR